tara:strand:+ start:129 stop:659 length:531 start_codon:yes stop_codon:yes gene_type:complete
MTKIFETADILKIQDEYRTSKKFDGLKTMIKCIKDNQRVSWSYLYAHKDDLEGIYLDGDYLGVTLQDFSNANFKNSFLAEVRFDTAQLTNANFNGSTFWDVSFADATLDGADFRGAHILYAYRQIEAFFDPVSCKGLLLKDTTFESYNQSSSDSISDSYEIEKIKKMLKENGAIFS